MTDLSGVLAHLEPQRLDPAPPGTPQLLVKLAEVWPHPLPPDQWEYLSRYDFYQGPLLEVGKVVAKEYRLFDAATVLEELDYFVADLEWPGLLPVCGRDSWRECLTSEGRYVTADMSGGDVVQDWDASSLAELLTARITWLAG